VDVRASGTEELAAENERLKARVETLEAQLAEQAARANAAVARAEERVYWLDRWRLDLNALMQRPVARHFPAFVDALRHMRHRLQRLRRRLTG
jgi:hypothetical protein